MLSPKGKRNLQRIIPFGVIWLVFCLVYLAIEKGILGDSEYYPSTGNPYDFNANITFTVIFAAVFGLLVGTFEVLFLNKVFVKTTFLKKITYKTLIYIFIICSFLVMNTALRNTIEMQTHIFDQQVWSNVKDFLNNFAFWSVVLYIAAIIVVSLFYTEVSDNLGQNVVTNFFTGKYHAPIEEERIFMFLDMKSSTTIAEKLGHVKYFEMLKEYYADLSDPIVEYGGEVYQYVGDEVIVSWTMKNGLAKSNCIKCFFGMKEALSNRAEKYQKKYKVVPTFKAGFHFGKITAGEIGVIKKDITFSGDILNTTARIQGQCNTFEVDLLLSNQLVEILQLSPEFKPKALGEVELRGKNTKVGLSTILMN